MSDGRKARLHEQACAAYGGCCATCGSGDRLVVEGLRQVPGHDDLARYEWLRSHGWPVAHDHGEVQLLCRNCWRPAGLEAGVQAAYRRGLDRSADDLRLDPKVRALLRSRGYGKESA